MPRKTCIGINNPTKEFPNIFIANMPSGKRRICYWRNNGKAVQMYYSRWLWEKKNGAIPDGCVIHHKDRDTLNDSIENLELLKISEHAKIGYRKTQEYREWSKFLYQHSHKDYCQKYSYFQKWLKMEGDDQEKVITICRKFGNQYAHISRLTGIDLAIISKMKDGYRKVSKSCMKKLLDLYEKSA